MLALLIGGNKYYGRNRMITECDLADEFVEQHNAYLRFSCKQAQWFINTPEGWIRDDTIAVFDLARQYCRKVSDDMPDDTQRAWLCSYTTIRNVLWLARTYREVAVATMAGTASAAGRE